MQEKMYSAIHAHPEFKKLEARRARWSWLLTLIILVTYFAFILTIAFRPELLATPISDHSVISWGIPLGLLIIVFSFILTGVYVHKANTQFDPAREAFIRDIEQVQKQEQTR